MENAVAILYKETSKIFHKSQHFTGHRCLSGCLATSLSQPLPDVLYSALKYRSARI